MRTLKVGSMRSPVPASVALTILLVLTGAMAGCTGGNPESLGLGLGPKTGYAAMGFDGAAWPNLHGAKVRVLAYDSFASSFKDHQAAFEGLTNGTVELLTESDTGKVLERAIREKGSPSFDVIYGIDNVLMGKAVREGIFLPYKPLLSDRVHATYAFLPDWTATPVDHGYISVNIDPRANLTVRTLDELKAHANKFVTEDPRLSTPGLGFLVATVATYGETGSYTYLDYWRDLFRGGVLVSSDWTDAYANHFSGGYGQFDNASKADKPIVTSYTTSPAFEMYYGYDQLNLQILAPKSTFHQIQTMGIAKGTPHLAAAQAWIEYTLTNQFQGDVAKGEAIYPVVDALEVDKVYLGKDPTPGTFQDTGLTYQQLDAGIERWIQAWTEAYEKARA